MMPKSSVLGELSIQDLNPIERTICVSFLFTPDYILLTKVRWLHTQYDFDLKPERIVLFSSPQMSYC